MFRGVIIAKNKTLLYGVSFNSSILQKKYGIEMKVVRNLPYLNTKIHVEQSKNTIIYQGSLNPGRGLDLAIQSMKYLP